MSYKITHQRVDQQLRFPNRAAAERYAEHDGGGHENWAITNVLPQLDHPGLSSSASTRWLPGGRR